MKFLKNVDLEVEYLNVNYFITTFQVYIFIWNLFCFF